MANQALVMQFDPADKRRLEAFMANVAAGVSNLDPFFDAVEMHMIDSLTQNFEAEGRPKRWDPLSPVTIMLKGSDRILQDTGDLKGSLNASNTDRDNLSLKIWAGSSHGQYHQDPDTDPLSQWGMRNARNIPFRPFMLFQQDDIKEIENILIKYVDDVMGGA